MINKVLIIGNVGKDAELRTFEGGNSKAFFSVATTETYKDKSGEKQKKTEWHNVVVWGKLAEIAAKYVRKGMLVYVEGKITTRQFDDKDGNKKYITEIVAENFQMLSKKEAEEATNDIQDLPF